jgi:single-stranded-DNA-specific exonuclease
VVDVAYRLRMDEWQGERRLQLEIAALRASAAGADGQGEVVLRRRERTYWCRRLGDGLVIRNAAGDEIRQGLAQEPAEARHPYVRALLQDAALALGLAA